MTGEPVAPCADRVWNLTQPIGVGCFNRPPHSLQGHYAQAMPRPYADAPRLPEAALVDVHALARNGSLGVARGEWVELEIGPGRGWFLVERAEIEPRASLVGLEVRRKWASIVDARLAERGLGARARVFAEDASIALPRLSPDGSVRRIFVHFPDPWWKKRHQKRLVVRDRFVDEAARLLEPGGELFVQTDVEERAVGYEQLVSFDPRFLPNGDGAASPRLRENPYGARSPRERRAIADGLPVYRLRWRRAGVHEGV
jgi:tRNA (guanine-N7-)-methyltransferase